MPLIDTRALKTGLLGGGMPEPQATAIVAALADADTGQLATKADMEGLRADVRTEISGIRTEVEVLRGDVKTLRWMVGFCLPCRSWCSVCCGGYFSLVQPYRVSGEDRHRLCAMPIHAVSPAIRRCGNRASPTSPLPTGWACKRSRSAGFSIRPFRSRQHVLLSVLVTQVAPYRVPASLK